MSTITAPATLAELTALEHEWRKLVELAGPIDTVDKDRYARRVRAAAASVTGLAPIGGTYNRKDGLRAVAALAVMESVKRGLEIEENRRRLTEVLVAVGEGTPAPEIATYEDAPCTCDLDDGLLCMSTTAH